MYKAHIWYEGTSHRYTSPGTKVKVICKGHGQISGSCFSKDGCGGGGIPVSQTHLVFSCLHNKQLLVMGGRKMARLGCCHRGSALTYSHTMTPFDAPGKQAF